LARGTVNPSIQLTAVEAQFAVNTYTGQLASTGLFADGVFFIPK
jgi:hypothetical protein